MLPLVPTQFQPTGQFLSTQVTYVLFDPCVAQNMLGQLNRRLELAGTEDAVDPDNIWFLFGISLGTHTEKVNWDPRGSLIKANVVTIGLRVFILYMCNGLSSVEKILSTKVALEIACNLHYTLGLILIIIILLRSQATTMETIKLI
jgi:hypothetical protein